MREKMVETFYKATTRISCKHGNGIIINYHKICWFFVFLNPLPFRMSGLWKKNYFLFSQFGWMKKTTTNMPSDLWRHGEMSCGNNVSIEEEIN